MINKDSSFDLRKAYYQLLTSTPIVYNSQTIGVYDEVVANNANYPCIVLRTQENRMLRSKDTWQQDTSIEISVIQRYTSDKGGKKEVNDIANLVINRVLTSNSTFGIQQYLTDWQVINCEYQTNSVILQVSSGWQVEQNIFFMQLLNQLN